MALYGPLPSYQMPGALDFGQLGQGLNALGGYFQRKQKKEEFDKLFAGQAEPVTQGPDGWQTQTVLPNKFVQAGLNPAMVDVAKTMGYEHGPNALLQAYAQQQQRDLTQRHYDAQIAQQKAQLAHQDATLAETRRYHSGVLDMARQRHDDTLDYKRQRFLRDGSAEGGDLGESSDVGVDKNGGFFLRAASRMPDAPTDSRFIPTSARPGIGFNPLQQGLPIDRVQSSPLPGPIGGGPLPGIQVDTRRSENPGFHPGAKALARQEADQIVSGIGGDLRRLDPQNPTHSVLIQKLGDAYGGGKLDKGKRWTLDQNHRLSQEDIPGSTKLTAGERKGEAMALMGLKALDQSERDLLGKVENKDGEYTISGEPRIGALKQLLQSPIDLPGAGRVHGGFGQTAQAYKSSRAAVTALNFYMSGAGVSNAERNHFLELYDLTPNESKSSQAWKIGRLRDYFETVKNVRSGEQVQNITRQYIQQNSVSEPAPEQSSRQSAGRSGTSLQEARDAIAKGAPRDAVIDRLRKMGVDPKGL